MTRAIVINKKIVGFEPIKEEPIKHTAEEYAKRQQKVVEKYRAMKEMEKAE